MNERKQKMRYVLILSLGGVSIAFLLWLNGAIERSSLKEDLLHESSKENPTAPEKERDKIQDKSNRVLAQINPVENNLQVEKTKRTAGEEGYVSLLYNTDYKAKDSLLNASDTFISNYTKNFFSTSPEQFQRTTQEEPEGIGLKKVSYEQWWNDIPIYGAGIDLVYNVDGTLLQVSARVATESVQSKASSAQRDRISQEEALTYVWDAIIQENQKYNKQDDLRKKISETGNFYYYLDDYGSGHRITQVYRFIANLEQGVTYEFIVDAAKGRSGIAIKRSLIKH